jgi:hypothetical protein
MVNLLDSAMSYTLEKKRERNAVRAGLKRHEMAILRGRG